MPGKGVVRRRRKDRAHRRSQAHYAVLKLRNKVDLSPREAEKIPVTIKVDPKRRKGMILKEDIFKLESLTDGRLNHRLLFKLNTSGVLTIGDLALKSDVELDVIYRVDQTTIKKIRAELKELLET